MKTGICEYCHGKGPLFIGPPEYEYEVYVCVQCMKLLKNPVTALPLIRGNITLKLRGEVNEAKFTEMLESYMGMLSKFRRVEKN